MNRYNILFRSHKLSLPITPHCESTAAIHIVSAVLITPHACNVIATVLAPTLNEGIDDIMQCIPKPIRTTLNVEYDRRQTNNTESQWRALQSQSIHSSTELCIRHCDELMLAMENYLDDPVSSEQHFQALLTNKKIEVGVLGTPFQKRVWCSLRKIKCGQTASYKNVADDIGRPNSYRAVAMACASNPWSIFIPCHRVVKSDGQLGGFRWGAQLKQRLLDIEYSAVSKI